jgi:hypothetical protein
MAEKVEVKFIVRKKFKYGDKIMMPGDTFVPAGGKFDDKIIRHLCRLDTDEFKPKERIGPQRRHGSLKATDKKLARLASRKFEPKRVKEARTPEQQAQLKADGKKAKADAAAAKADQQKAGE